MTMNVRQGQFVSRALRLTTGCHGSYLGIRQAELHAERYRKLEAAREERRQRRQLKTEAAVA